MTPLCPACGASTLPLGDVPFTRNCGNVPINGPTGLWIVYRRCIACGFATAESMATWTEAEYRDRVYNDDYHRVDPEYDTVRPRNNATACRQLVQLGQRHLDYGGGNGLLAKLLRLAGLDSHSFDPLTDPPRELGLYDVVTAFEVAEHHPAPQRLATEFRALLKPDGVVYFSTLLSDRVGDLLDWWYLAPRNGHVSLYTRRSLEQLGRRVGLRFGSFAENSHAFWQGSPPGPLPR